MSKYTKQRTIHEFMKNNEREFLCDLVSVLAGRDLSNINLKSLPGIQNRSHNALFDNYEINIARTPVFVHKNKLAQLFGVGDWRFQEDVFERYEIIIFENMQNTRVRDMIRLAGEAEKKTHNVIMARGTMASNRGYYNCSRHESNDNNTEEGLYFEQNAHLFTPAKQLYNIFDAEYARRQAQIHPYPLSNVASPNSLCVDVRKNILAAVKSKVK